VFSARAGVVWSSGLSSKGVQGSVACCGKERSATGVGGSNVASRDLSGVAAVSGLAWSSHASG